MSILYWLYSLNCDQGLALQLARMCVCAENSYKSLISLWGGILLHNPSSS